MKTILYLLAAGATCRQIRRGTVPKSLRRGKKAKEELKIAAIIMIAITPHPKLYIKWNHNDAQDALKAQSVHDKTMKSTWMLVVANITDVLSAYQSAIKDWLVLIATAEKGTKLDKIKLAIYSANFKSITSVRIIELAQAVADENIDKAEQVASSCDMDIKGKGGRTTQEWLVTRESEGCYKLTAVIGDYSSKHYVVQWQRTASPLIPGSWYSLENEIIPTPNSSTNVKDLPLGEIYYFRYRIITCDIVTDWSYYISLVIS